MKATKRATRRWLLELMGRLAPQTVADAERNADMATPSYVNRFEAAVFCQQSLDDIAGQVRFWNEALVSTALEAWSKAHLESDTVSTTLPPEADAAPLSIRGKHLFARFLAATDDHAARGALGLVRSVEPSAYRWIADHDMRAADIVVTEGWGFDAGDTSDWEDPDKVHRAAVTLMTAYRDTAERQGSRSAGLDNFKSLPVLSWDCACTALIAAVGAHGRQNLPIIRDEMEAAKVGHRRRPRLFE